MTETFLDPQDLRARLKGLRKWLSPPDREWNYMLLDRTDSVTMRHTGTCTWFKPNLQSFVESVDQSILVVIGAPGVGKSVLSGWILDEFETEPDKEERVILYFHLRKSVVS